MGTAKAALPAALLGFFLFMSVFAMRDNAHNPDESCRIASGYAYLKKGNLRLNPEDPPLGKEVAALPLLFMGVQLPMPMAALTPGNIGRGDSFKSAERLLYEQPSLGSLLAWGQAEPWGSSGWGSDSWKWLAQRKPDIVIGRSLYLFHVEEPK